MHDQLKLRCVMLFALAQGLLYLVLIPPWQHYDEPTHFEHAWLLANRTWHPAEADVDLAMRRAVVASMVEHHFYRYNDLPEPDLRDPAAAVAIGISELRHPPLYYALVSLPLRLARATDITAQLYLARAVSLLLFLLTIASAALLSGELTPPGHPLRWAIPLALSLPPPFVALMTGVNNDAGAVWMLALFLWLGVRTLRRGLSWPRGLGLLVTAALCALMKSTGAVALLLLPVVLGLALWQRRGWRWRWLAGAGAGVLVVAGLALADWHDAAYWYFPEPRPAQSPHSRLASPAAPHGAALLTLAIPVDAAASPQLISPLLPAAVRALRGRPVTVGGWLWADRPASGAYLALIVATADAPERVGLTQPLTVTTSPRFVAWHATVPAGAREIFFVVAAPPLPGAPPAALQLFLDGAVLVEGTWPLTSAPRFNSAEATSGSWAGEPFVNRLRNPSAEQVWPRLNPALDRWLASYGQVEATLGLASLLDYKRTGAFLLGDLGPRLAAASFTTLGWGQVEILAPRHGRVLLLIPLVALLGLLRWGAARWRAGAPPGRAPALGLLALCACLLWAATIFRALPALSPRAYVPAPRYASPALLPLVMALAAGWWALPPLRWRPAGLGAFLGLMLLLNMAGLWTIWSFFAA
jgi:hypothetical protein